MLIRPKTRNLPQLRALALCLFGLSAASFGSAFAQDLVDGDADGVPFAIDECPYSRPGEFVDARGCTTLRDSDEDGIADVFDDCPLTRIGAQIGPDGCSIDTDRDGVADGLNRCPGTPSSQAPDSTGCSLVQLARQRGAAAAPEVFVGRPRPSREQAQVLIETPRPVVPEPIPAPVVVTVQPQPQPVAQASKPAAVFSASGRDVDFVAFESLNFSTTVQPSLESQAAAIADNQVLTDFASGLAASARFARPSPQADAGATPRPTNEPALQSRSIPALKTPIPVVPAPLPVPRPQLAPVRAVPSSSPRVAAVTLSRPETANAMPVPVTVPRTTDPAAYTPLARAVANALLGLAPEAVR